MSTKRLNITLPEDVVSALGPISNKSRFIAEAVREKLVKDHHKRLDILLIEGYKAAAGEAGKTDGEWDSVSLENWD